MSGLRTLLVDDEPLARAALRAILSEDPELTIVGECGSGAEAIGAIDALAPDVVFLDLTLPDRDGFEVIQRIAPDRRPAVVVVTADPARALRAFEYRALDYVTKPLRRDRIREAVARARERIRPLRPPAADPRPAVVPPLALKIDGSLKLLDQSTIDWISADDDHVVVHAGDKIWRARETLTWVSRRLDPARFVRIHRSTVVRLARIRELQPWFHGDYVVVLHNGTELRLSRNYREQVTRLLGRG